MNALTRARNLAATATDACRAADARLAALRRELGQVCGVPRLRLGALAEAIREASRACGLAAQAMDEARGEAMGADVPL